MYDVFGVVWNIRVVECAGVNDPSTFCTHETHRRFRVSHTKIALVYQMELDLSRSLFYVLSLCEASLVYYLYIRSYICTNIYVHLANKRPQRTQRSPCFVHELTPSHLSLLYINVRMYMYKRRRGSSSLYASISTVKSSLDHILDTENRAGRETEKLRIQCRFSDSDNS